MRHITTLLFSAAVLIIYTFIQAPGQASETGALTFDEFHKRVLEYYPRLKAGSVSVEQALNDKLSALSGFYPRLRGSASYTVGNNQVYVFGSKLQQKVFTSDDFLVSKLNSPDSLGNFNFTLQGEMPFFDAFQTILRVKTAEMMVGSAKYEEEFTRMEALLISSEAFLRALSVAKTLDSVNAVVKEAQADIAQAEDLNKKGMILGADFYSAKFLLGSMQQVQNDLIREKAKAMAIINILMGDDPLLPAEISGSLGEDPADGKPIEAWITESLLKRPDILAMDLAIKAGRTDLKRERLSFLPKISGFGNVQENTYDFDQGGLSYTAGAVATMDIFDPTYRSRVRGSKLNLDRTEISRMLLEESVKSSVISEFYRYSALSSNASVLRTMLEDSRNATELMLPLYREGRKSIADLLEIRRGYIETLRGYNDILAGLKMSRSRLYFVSGQLDETTIGMIVTQ